MVYCRDCGEAVEESDVYCWQCGTDLTADADEPAGDELATAFWDMLEWVIDAEIDHIATSEVSVTPPLLDRFTFAYQMYIMGFTKGIVYTVFLSAVDDPEEDTLDADLSPIYERIVEAVQDRENRLRDGLREASSPAAGKDE